VIEKRDVSEVYASTPGPSLQVSAGSVLYLTGLSQRDLYGQMLPGQEEITMNDLSGALITLWPARSRWSATSWLATGGTAPGHGPVHRRAHGAVRTGAGERRLSARRSSSRPATRPARPPSVAFDDVPCFDSERILGWQVPRSLVVVGAGVIGHRVRVDLCALGTKVTVIEQRDRMLDFCDRRSSRRCSSTSGTWRSPPVPRGCRGGGGARRRLGGPSRQRQGSGGRTSSCTRRAARAPPTALTRN